MTRCTEALSKKRSRSFKISIGLLVAILGTAHQVGAQTEPEPIMEGLREAFSQEGLTLGMLLQAVVDPAVDGSDSDPASVQVAAMRILLSGRLDGGFEYHFQTNFAASPSILDARVGWNLSEQLGIWAGRFKAPFSREFLTFAGAIDFVNRARAVSTLVPGRQMGVQLRGQAGSGANWALGGFTGADNSPANEALVGVARFEVTPSLDREDTQLSIAAAAAVGRDAAIADRAIAPTFDGDGSVFGVDARFTAGRFLFAGEGMLADYDPLVGAGTDAAGLYLTAGWMTDEKSQVLLRWDRYRPVGGQSDDTLVLGFNSWPTTASEIQVNWVVPIAGSPSPHKLLINFQLGF